ncbi:dihydroorotate dehydrogenase (quinone) [Candidatus Pacearchaeota archaeon]|nr:dihydroorotate dehydrogenase (quinone) [Candidatus Pacearchaeota archaeon]
MIGENIVHSLLLRLPPERAHKIGIWAIQNKINAPGRYAPKELKTSLFGVELDNPLGIAAGFDKYVEVADEILDYGFGFIELGSFTNLGGEGNPDPRLFRLRRDRSLLNRMGLNGDPAEENVERIKKIKHPYFGINIAKTHNPIIVGDRAIVDVVSSYKLLKSFGIYTVLNLSCPNTKEGKTFEEPGPLDELLSAVLETGKGKPLLVKISPTLTKEQLIGIVNVADDRVDGYVCGNTKGINHPKYGKGGLSGKLIREISLNLINSTRQLTKKPIIGVGGISSGGDMFDAYINGANIYQTYTGFIYEGTGFAQKTLRDFVRIKKAFEEMSFKKE